jgi:hypothetical protein
VVRSSSLRRLLLRNRVHDTGGTITLVFFRLSNFIIAALLLVILSWHYVTDYRSAPRYFCEAPLTRVVPHPYIPLIGDFVFTDSLEVYIGGWIERGTLEIEGSILNKTPLTFSAGKRPTPIQHARLGEWYENNFQLVFKPSGDASCFVRVVYRFRGIY